MKTIKWALAGLIGIALSLQGWNMSTTSEEQPYEVLKKLEEVEIRHYPPARMISVDNQSNRNNSFMTLAGYIFGGNSEQEKFAMTAPVSMQRTESGSRMSFMLPEEAWERELPKPDDQKVQIHWSEDEYIAAIRYRGYRSFELESEHRDRLIEILKKNGIEHNGDFRSLGYDRPSKTQNRRNEVIVSIKWPS